jgi:hypothetical protein
LSNPEFHGRPPSSAKPYNARPPVFFRDGNLTLVGATRVELC